MEAVGPALSGSTLDAGLLALGEALVPSCGVDERGLGLGLDVPPFSSLSACDPIAEGDDVGDVLVRRASAACLCRRL